VTVTGNKAWGVNPLPKYYYGPLTPAQVAEGIQSAVSNAKKLYAEAKLLLEAQYWERAAVLAIQSMEEAAKPRHLRILLLAKTVSFERLGSLIEHAIYENS
jgi:hypothetical protein